MRASALSRRILFFPPHRPSAAHAQRTRVCSRHSPLGPSFSPFPTKNKNIATVSDPKKTGTPFSNWYVFQIKKPLSFKNVFMKLSVICEINYCISVCFHASHRKWLSSRYDVFDKFFYGMHDNIRFSLWKRLKKISERVIFGRLRTSNFNNFVRHHGHGQQPSATATSREDTEPKLLKKFQNLTALGTYCSQTADLIAKRKIKLENRMGLLKRCFI